jgi:hypothetical protein
MATRRHRAARARNLVLAGSLAGFTGITGALVGAHLPTSAQTVAAVSSPTTTPPAAVTTPTTTATTAYSPYAPAVPSSNRSAAAAATSSRGS